MRPREQSAPRVERLAPKLLEISHSLHANPELGFEEHHAHEVLTAAIEDEGLSVERGAYDLSTAFDTRAGTDGPTIAVCCEIRRSSGNRSCPVATM